MRPESSNGTVLTVTVNALISNRNCIATSLALNPAAAACTVALYDLPPPADATVFTQGNATTVGATLKVTLVAPASVGSVSSQINASGIEFANGCIAVVTGAGATANVGWQVI